jgi:hypothetical protein
MMSNPFEAIEQRLITIESLLRDLKKPEEKTKPVEFDEMNGDQARELLGSPGKPLSKSKLYKLSHERLIPFKKFGSRLVFSRKELIEWKNIRIEEPSYNGWLEDQLRKSAQKKLAKG